MGVRLVFLLATGALAVACGSEVVVDPTAAAGSSSAASGQGGGGVGGATSASSTADGTGGATLYCSAMMGTTCGPGEFCDYAGDHCGGTDGQGVCTPMPGGCADDCGSPVCGCDGQVYCSTCVAHAAGVDVDALGTCMEPGNDARAFYLGGGLDHLVVTVADHDRNICLRLWADAPIAPVPGLDVTIPEPWAVSWVEATSQAVDCVSPYDTPMGSVIGASGAFGSVAWPPEEFIPCVLDIDVVALFDAPEAPWIFPEEVMFATGVEVEGGCF